MTAYRYAISIGKSNATADLHESDFERIELRGEFECAMDLTDDTEFVEGITPEGDDCTVYRTRIEQ